MSTRVRPRKAVFIGMVAALLVGTAAVGASRPSAGEEFYSRIAAAAAEGDARAIEAKAAVDAFMSRNGMTPSAMGEPRQSVVGNSDLGIPVRLDGILPWSVRIVNDAVLDSRASIDGYRALRHDALAALARSPQREIRAVVSPNRFMSLQEFGASLPCACRGYVIVVDVFGANGWLMSSGGNFGGIELPVSMDALEQDLLDQARQSLDQFAAKDTADLRLTVRQVEVSLTAMEAKSISTEPGILLVDPLTDLADRYGSMAAVVEVSGSPSAFAAYAEYVLGSPLVPGAARPQKEH